MWTTGAHSIQVINGKINKFDTPKLCCRWRWWSPASRKNMTYVLFQVTLGCQGADSVMGQRKCWTVPSRWRWTHRSRLWGTWAEKQGAAGHTAGRQTIVVGVKGVWQSLGALSCDLEVQGMRPVAWRLSGCYKSLNKVRLRTMWPVGVKLILFIFQGEKVYLESQWHEASC